MGVWGKWETLGWGPREEGNGMTWEEGDNRMRGQHTALGMGGGEEKDSVSGCQD